MSSGDSQQRKELSRVMKRRLQNDILLFLSAMIVVSLGKSMHHLIPLSLLFMINSLDSLIRSNSNAFLPSRMEVNSGRSIHHSLSGRFTLKHNTRTTTE